MNDFDRTPAARSVSDSDDTLSDSDVLTAGLLPRDHACRGATFVRRPDCEQTTPERERTRMYQALAVRVGAEPTTLLVGPHAVVSPTRTYRVEAVRKVASGRLATIQFCPTSARLEQE
ncbi:hypothetical protein [Halorussus ruber]|uniref:hypothetical protein n=1 Tax=Halorussus ruber TaxID=1126238 RepID=UPI0010930C5A|nr:hypothetical protein [Halorussus ruber]